MKILFIGLAILAVVCARPQNEESAEEAGENVAVRSKGRSRGDGSASVIEQDSQADPDKGTYRFKFETSNHIEREEKGHIKKIDDKNSVLKVKGETTYTAPNGKIIHLRYKAGPLGYQAEGDYVPETPEIVKELIALLTGNDQAETRSAPKPKKHEENKEDEDEENDDEESGDEQGAAEPQIQPPQPAPPSKPAGAARGGIRNKGRRGNRQGQ